ncbi:hypothetical protein DW228_12225 [Bacteroides fragilis]|uniref:Transmembrane protein n=1 Tax=Bacteroides fragilis TaxID=817 RepID=A0A396C1B7_BACFG|nr:hypothetical protein DW228_12225 [Bacteroides fragilis]
MGILFSKTSPCCYSILFTLFFRTLSFFSGPLSNLSLFFLKSNRYSMDLSCLNTIHLLLTDISTDLVNNKKSYYTFIYKYNTILLYDKYIQY